MTKFRIRSLPCDDSLGGLQFEKTTPDDQGKRLAQGSDPRSLLSEAIRFYNYGIERPTAGLGASGFEFTKDRIAWLPLTPKIMRQAMQDLCRIYCEILIDDLEQLCSSRALQQHLQEGIEQQYPVSVSANRGLLAAHLLLSPLFRRETGRPKRWLVREFEMLAPALLDLRRAVNKEYIEQSLAHQYGRDLPSGANVDDCLFQPYWGGSWLIRAKEAFRYPGRPFYPHDRREVGATEKLYISVISSAFMPEDIIIRTVRENEPLTDCEYLEEIYRYTARVEAILPAIDGNRARRKKTACWRAWHDNLRALELLFGQALELRAVAYGTEQRHGVRVGLPGAFGLIGVLHAYLTEMKARALMIALPMAIQQLYNNVNGYLGVAMWEALTGDDARGILHRGCLGWMEDRGVSGKQRLLGVLAPWRNIPVSEQDFWGKAEPVQKAARDALKRIIPPLPGTSLLPDSALLRSHIGFVELLEQVDTLRDFYRNFGETLPRYPAITKELGITLGADSDWLFGARFTAQAHLFIAHQLVERAGQILWQRPQYTTPDHNESKFKKRRQLRNIVITAGSYAWGGKKPPHVTHRDGVSFDVCFGPDIVTWPEFTDIKYAWQACMKSGKIGVDQVRQIESQSSLLNVKRRGYGWVYSPVAVCFRPDEYRIEQTGAVVAYSSERLVYRQLLYDDAVKTYKTLVGYALHTLGGKDPLAADEIAAWFEKEEDSYDEAEARYIGTPHFLDNTEARGLIDPRFITELPDWQRTHATHVALLLSGARNIVFASAIVHFRAMRAVRTAFRGRQCFAGASALVANAGIGFDPSGHWHHWHVEFPRTDVLAAFRSCFPVWFELGIDLQPFIHYLQKYPLPEQSGPALVKTLDEYHQTLAACIEYQQGKAKYEQEQGYNAETASNRSDELLRILFSQFESNQKLISPTLRIGHLLGEEGSMLSDARQKSKRLVQTLESTLRQAGCVSRIRDDREEELWDEVPWFITV
jgi:hypothetical protein